MVHSINTFWRLFSPIDFKRVFNYCQTSVLFFITGGILSGYLSLLALHLSETPLTGLVLDPVAAFTSTTVYVCVIILPLPGLDFAAAN